MISCSISRFCRRSRREGADADRVAKEEPSAAEVVEEQTREVSERARSLGLDLTVKEEGDR
jgi:hypothetical protein